jgi:hypothetical protein
MILSPMHRRLVTQGDALPIVAPVRVPSRSRCRHGRPATCDKETAKPLRGPLIIVVAAKLNRSAQESRPDERASCAKSRSKRSARKP